MDKIFYNYDEYKTKNLDISDHNEIKKILPKIQRMIFHNSILGWTSDYKFGLSQYQEWYLTGEISTTEYILKLDYMLGNMTWHREKIVKKERKNE